MATTASGTTAPIVTPNVYPFPEKKNNNQANNNYYYTRAREDINLGVQMVAEMYYDTLGREMPRYIGHEVQGMIDAGIQPDMICAVLAYTAGAPRPSWAYARVVLEKQAQMGAKTAEQFHENIGKWRDSRSRQPCTNARPVQEHRYSQRPADPADDDIPPEQLEAMQRYEKP